MVTIKSIILNTAHLPADLEQMLMPYAKTIQPAETIGCGVGRYIYYPHLIKIKDKGLVIFNTYNPPKGTWISKEWKIKKKLAIEDINYRVIDHYPSCI